MPDPLKICLYGPESVGKTTLAQQLADHYHTVYVPEVARDLILSGDLTNVELNSSDYARIAVAQTEAVTRALPLANRVLICDTDLITTQLYADVYGVAHPPILTELAAKEQFDAYFLLNTDVPWVADGLRDLGDRREEMYHLFEQALTRRGIHYVVVSGRVYAARKQQVIDAIDALLGEKKEQTAST
ncbi:putative ATPase/kinase involved in NAD metabolism [Fibrella aestuarina BUZ 2]|uniref:Putative ATPase/kinase involved in NAD metabolism n=1 Tax=Fibrella aestuarina BUZ 2 TaxID=1166018 RepID=I0KC85_9BACT|nr:AAA family ATPase [Fibrella aestuarina]CCH01738.1 putative ATPase/kinase involved in NAD metabolism [Fibrella aestuarina BUZ 2]